jgi:hypothetical protein
MGQTARPAYRFEGLPLDPVDPGTTLLVTGPSIGGTRELCMELLGSDDDGVLLVSADLDGPNAIDAYERLNGRFDPARMAVVDCTQHGETDPTRNVSAIGTPGDLTGIGMHYSRLYEELAGAGVEQIRTGLYTLTTILPYVEEIQPVYRFLHSITGRIRSAGGFGAVAMDPNTQDERVLGSLAQPFDGQLELRRDEDDGPCEIRLRGLPDHDTDWRSYDPPA